MDVHNCRICGRLFNYLSGPDVCPGCREAAEKKFQDVKEYVRDNPGATIPEVADNNDVTTNQIRQWIREERLQFSDDSPVGIECEKCGTQIKTGRFCEACKNKMASALSDSIAKPAPKPVEKKSKPNDKMFHL